jgi:hypothetical protein
MYSHENHIKIIEEGHKAFQDGKSIYENPYRNSMGFDSQAIQKETIWNDAFMKAKAKAEDNTGKILGKIDLNKVYRK